MSETAQRTSADRVLRGGLAAAAVMGGAGALELLRRRVQRSNLYLPARYPNGIWNPAQFGLDAEDVWFEAEDGVGLHGWWVPHRRALGTILYCHGNTGSIGHQVGVLSHLRRLRMNVFAFDYRGYGRSSGEPSERGLFADVRGAYGVLTGRWDHDPASMVLFGHSLGGAVAIDCARDRAVAGLIVQSTFTGLRAASRAVYPVPGISWITSNHYRNREKVGEIRTPKLFVHGSADGTLPVSMAEELHAAAAEPKRLYIVPRAGHNDVHRRGGLRYLWTLGRFARGCVKRPG